MLATVPVPSTFFYYPDKFCAWKCVGPSGSLGLGKDKSKGHPITGHEGPKGEQRYRSTLSLTSALDEGCWSTPRPGRSLPPGKTRYPLYRKLGGPQGRSGQVRKALPPTGIRSPDRPARSESLHRLSYPGP
jgi:hypothetical protein